MMLTNLAAAVLEGVLSIDLTATTILAIVMFNVLVIGLLGGVAFYVVSVLHEVREPTSVHPPQPAAAPTIHHLAPLTERRRAS